MTRPRIGSFFRPVGALRAPTVFLALAFLAFASAPVAAHGPIQRRPQTEPPPGTVLPPGPTLDQRDVETRGGAIAGGVPTTGVLTLSQLAAQSTLIVEGVVARTASLDDGRLLVSAVQVTRTVEGHADGAEVAVLELRGATTRPGLLPDAMRAVVLLQPPPALSYLSQQLPDAGVRYVLTGGRDGIIPIANDAEAELVRTTLAEALRIARITDETEAHTADRALALTEMRTGQARLEADALVRLRRLNEVTSLTADEQRALADLLAKPTVPAATRVGFVRLAADRGWKDAVPALRAASVESAEMLDAVLAARARLGAPADKAELRRYLDAKDPAVQAAAIRALAALPDSAVGDLGRYATSDKAVGVRVAAIEALGATKQAAAIPTLSQTFGEPTREVRQASGRALLAIGGDAANDAFINLALHGGDADTRKYAAVLLLVSTGKDSPAVQRLMASNPGGEVRDIVEHGLQWQHSHQHVAE